MSKITAEMVKQLRDRTGVGMSKCKKALDEADGDMDVAIDNLRKAGMASAVKKSDREAKEGLIGFAESSDAITLIELNCETDFVTKNEKFKEFLKHLCADAAASKPASLEDFTKQSYSGKKDISIEEMRAELVLSLGENIQIRRLEIIPKEEGNSYGLYSHMGGTIVTFVEIGGDSDQASLAKDIAMHIAAEAPEYLSPSGVPENNIAREKEIAREQIGKKPDHVIEKILEGKMRSFYEQTCLTEQKFVKDPSMTIANLLETAGKKSAQPLKIVQFLRWQVGSI